MTPLSVPFVRAVRARRPRVALPLVLVAAIIAAFRVRALGSAALEDRLLTDLVGRFALPLVAFTVATAVFEDDRFDRAVAPLVGLGAPAPRAAFGHVLASVVLSAASGVVLLAASAAVAHGRGVMPLAVDVGTSAFAGALGGAAYGALFAFGSTFGPRGAGRAIVWLVDLTLSGTPAFGALLLPMGHLNNLLGGSVEPDVAPPSSAIALVLFTLLYGAVAVRRTVR